MPLVALVVDCTPGAMSWTHSSSLARFERGAGR